MMQRLWYFSQRVGVMGEHITQATPTMQKKKDTQSSLIPIDVNYTDIKFSIPKSNMLEIITVMRIKRVQRFQKQNLQEVLGTTLVSPLISAFSNSISSCQGFRDLGNLKNNKNKAIAKILARNMKVPKKLRYAYKMPLMKGPMSTPSPTASSILPKYFSYSSGNTIMMSE